MFSSVESRFEIAFDSNANKVVIINMTTYSSPNVGNVIVGTVSGTDISFTTTQFLTGNPNGEDENDICFDSNANKMVLAYTDGTNSDYGTSKVFTVASTNLTSENYIGIAKGAAADGTSAVVQTSCSINDAQSGLTAGQDYFVQTDGTLGLTAADPSVFAGTAVSATKLIVKG
mgnify:CR=1 FL=1